MPVLLSEWAGGTPPYCRTARIPCPPPESGNRSRRARVAVRSPAPACCGNARSVWPGNPNIKSRLMFSKPAFRSFSYDVMAAFTEWTRPIVFEQAIVERLHAHRDAVDAKLAEQFRLLCRDGGRIAFDGPFDGGAHRRVTPYQRLRGGGASVARVECSACRRRKRWWTVVAAKHFRGCQSPPRMRFAATTSNSFSTAST